MHRFIQDAADYRKGILIHEVVEHFYQGFRASFSHKRVTGKERKIRGRTNMRKDTQVGWLRVSHEIMK